MGKLNTKKIRSLRGTMGRFKKEGKKTHFVSKSGKRVILRDLRPFEIKEAIKGGKRLKKK